jgi:hypothetical protein
MERYTREPRLSVYSIGSRSAADCSLVVSEMLRQTVRDDIELIIVTPDAAGLDPTLLGPFACWRILLVPEVSECGPAMAAAVRAARAPWVVYAEEHSYFAEDWAERLLAAHDRGYQAVGFAMANANPQRLVSWAHLYGQFSGVVEPAEAGERDFLAGHHVSYGRDFFLENYADTLVAAMEDESALFIDLRARGVPMYLAGDALSRHINISRLTSYLAMDYVGQRSFAGTRALLGRWSLLRRLVYAAGMPLAPLVRMRRILRDVRRTSREQLLPQILAPIGAALVCGMVGEMVGYIAGPGSSARQKVDKELQRQEFLDDGWTREEPLSAPADTMTPSAPS